MDLNLFYPFVAQLVFLAACLHLLSPGAARTRAVYSLLALLSSLIILMLPINGLHGFYYLRAYIGDLSITSSVFFGAYIIQNGFGINIYQAAEAKYLQTLAVLMGLFLYPFALGIGQLDPYRLGFHPQALTVALFVSAIYFWHKSYYFLLFVVTSVVLGYLLGLLESNNLWDYLLDAVLWLVCSAKIMFSGFRALPGKFRT
jgi:hypothetical protein